MTVHSPSDAAAPKMEPSSGLAAWLERGEPRLVRGPFARWPRASDAVLAVLVFVGSVVSVTASGLGDGEQVTTASLADQPPGAIVVLGMASASLWWRRTAPVAVTGFVLAGMLLWAAASYGDGNDLALVVALYSVGRYGGDQRLGLAVVVGAVAVGIVGTLVDDNQHVDVLPAVVVTVLPWYVGRRVRNRGDYVALLRERAERLEAEQHERAARAVAAERSRISRELHDEVAHQVSMMTVQAGAARTIARDDVETAIEAMGDVEQAGRRALDELRHLLGVLRRDDTDPDHLGPRPGLDDLPELADELAQTGADVTLKMGPLPDVRRSALDLSAYRIVQESFTNIIKHAGAKPTVSASVAVDGGWLVIEIVNSAGAATHGLPTSGYGIAGMRERVDLLGGTLTVGALPPGRYRVNARLPLDPGAGVTIRVAVVDDQALVRRGFTLVLDHQADITVVAEAGDGLQAIETTMQHRPDVVLMDIRMPELDGLAATSEIIERADWPVRVIILTTFDPDEYVYRALEAGASGFILKDIPPEQLAPAVRTVADGGALIDPAITRRLIGRFARSLAADTETARLLETLTEREREVLIELAKGSTNAEISDTLYIGAATVKTHVSSVLAKLALRDRAQAVVFAYESGLVTPGRRDDDR